MNFEDENEEDERENTKIASQQRDEMKTIQSSDKERKQTRIPFIAFRGEKRKKSDSNYE